MCKCQCRRKYNCHIRCMHVCTNGCQQMVAAQASWLFQVVVPDIARMLLKDNGVTTSKMGRREAEVIQNQSSNLANFLGWWKQVIIKFLVQPKLHLQWYQSQLCGSIDSMYYFRAISYRWSQSPKNRELITLTRISTLPKIFLLSAAETSFNFDNPTLHSQVALKNMIQIVKYHTDDCVDVDQKSGIPPTPPCTQIFP